MASPYEIAKQQGYSDEEIDAYLGKKDPRYTKARDTGYSREEIAKHLAKIQHPKESLGANIARQAGRTGARVAETVLGAPRALGEFGESLIPEKTLIKGAEKIGLGEGAKTLLELTKKFSPHKLFPKSEDIRENVTKHLFGEKLEPKNEWEKKADTLVSDFAALAIPLPGAQMKVLKPALLAAGGNIASEVIGQVGGTEKQKAYGKLGTILAGSMINPKSAEKLKDSLYAQAREAKPVDAKVTANTLVKKTNDFEKQLLKGDPSAGSKKKTLSLIKEIKDKVKNNKIDVDELEEFKRNINEARSGLYEEFKIDKVGRKSAKRNLDHVSNLIDDTLKEYGKTNPEWEAFYRPANEVHGAIAQSKRVRNWVGKNAKKIGFLPLLAEMGLYHYGGAPAAGAAALAGGAAAVGFVGSEIGARIMKSPTLRKHYMNVVNSALREDVVAVHENLKRLDSEMKKEKSNPKR